jgi:NAD(P)H-hydrate epimerase
MVLDADGLIAIASELLLLKYRAYELGKDDYIIVLTPHLGEFSVLTGKSIEELNKDPIGYANEFAKEHGVYVVLKGQPTILATPFGKIYLTTRGNPYMGTGGMGDVLAGIIGSMLNQEQNPIDAINIAIYAHSRAGDLALDDCGPGFTPTEVAQRIGRVLRTIEGCNQIQPL